MGPSLNPLHIYLAGEIHSDRRDRFRRALGDRGVDALADLPVETLEQAADAVAYIVE